MPLNPKGAKIKRAMIKQYGAKRGTQAFYASENSGRIKGVTKKRKKSGIKIAVKRIKGTKVRHIKTDARSR